MRKVATGIALAFTALLIAGKPASAQAVVARIYVAAPPPVEIVERAPPAPGPAYIWVKGYHVWRDGAYVWTPGRWAVPPHGMHVWVPGHWDHEGRGYFWVEGHWDR
jgi:hypothetical protein